MATNARAAISIQSGHLYDVLLAVAASGKTIQSVCQDLPGAPKADTVREHLNK